MSYAGIYIVGVPATGKTTLIRDLASHLQREEPSQSFIVVEEVARDIILNLKVHPQEIQSGSDISLQLQRQILETQAKRERQAAEAFVLSDRSGIDPIAFVAAYAKPSSVAALLEHLDWPFLRSRMQRSLVVLCEPMPQWFAEDGVRVVPASSAETEKLHQTFYQLLTDQDIPFHVLPSEMERREQRLGFVLTHRRQIEE